MAIRKNTPMGFVDSALETFGSTRITKLLNQLDAATPWKKLAQPIAKLPEYTNTKAGRPTWEPVLMLKCMMLAKWFQLSDPGLEEALKDRISFRKFVGLSFTDTTPDETTFVKFRKRLREAKIGDQLFHSVTKHLDSQGIIVHEGSLIDATIVIQSKGSKNDKGENKRDHDASFTKKNKMSYHGYKIHIASDLSGIVTDFRFSTARDRDSRYIDELIEDEDTLVLADSAYSSKERRVSLHNRGICDGIIHKRNRSQKELSVWQEFCNKVVSKLRSKVEHPFAMLKHQLGYRRVRYRGLERNELDVCFLLMACNLKRSVWLCAQASG